MLIGALSFTTLLCPGEESAPPEEETMENPETMVDEAKNQAEEMANDAIDQAADEAKNQMNNATENVPGGL